MPEEQPFLADMSPPGRKSMAVRVSLPKPAAAPADDAPVAKNPHVAFRDLYRDNHTIAEKIRQFHTTDDRHGDLYVIRSAAKRIIQNSERLIQIEEECP